MGCGSSSTSRSSVFSNGVDSKKLPDDVLSDIHGLLLNQDEAALQKLILPLPRSVQTTLNKEYHETYNKSLVSSPVLIDKLLWQLILCHDLPLLQLNYLINEIKTDDVMLILDVFLSVQHVGELKTAFDAGSPKNISEVLSTEQDLLNLINTGPVKDSFQLKLADGENVTVESLVSHFTKRLRVHLSNQDLRSALFILISRSEVDLCEIRVHYERLYSESLTNLALDNIQLLDHTSLKEASGKEQNAELAKTRSVNTEPAKNTESAKNTKSGDTVARRPCTADDDVPADYDANKAFSTNDPSVDTSTPPNIETPAIEGDKPLPEVEIRVEQLRRLQKLLEDKPLNSEEFSDCVVEIVSHNGEEDPLKVFSDIQHQGLLEALEAGLPRDTYTIVEYLFRDYQHASILLLNKSIQDNDQTTVDLILMVLLCSDMEQIKDITKTYPECTDESRSLTDVLTENLMGEFQRFVAALLKGERDESVTQDEEQAKVDASRLYKATDFKWNGDDNVFNEVFIKRNMKQLRLTFQYFVDESGTDITELILQEFSFHLQKALLNLVYIVNNGLAMFLAKFLHESRTKSHFPSVLIWIIAARYKLDFSSIRAEYRSKYDMPVTNLLENAKIAEESRVLLTKLCKT